jgi:hypothetical protein
MCDVRAEAGDLQVILHNDDETPKEFVIELLHNGLWLCQIDGLRYAVVLSSHREYGYEAGTRIEIVVPAGADGAEFVQRCFTELESAVNAARCYRGKIVSLDSDEPCYSGRERGLYHPAQASRSQQQAVSSAVFAALGEEPGNLGLAWP